MVSLYFSDCRTCEAFVSIAFPVSFAEEDWESTDAAKLFAMAEALGSRRVSDARVATFGDDCLVFLLMMAVPISMGVARLKKAPLSRFHNPSFDDGVVIRSNADSQVGLQQTAGLSGRVITFCPEKRSVITRCLLTCP